MSTQKNIRVVQALFGAMGRGDLEAALALTAGDIAWIVPGDWPLSGTHRGHAGLAAFFRKAAELVETAMSDTPEFIAQGDRVMVLGVSTGSIKATKGAFADHFVFAVTVLDGKVTHIREYIDTLALARAAGTATAGRP